MIQRRTGWGGGRGGRPECVLQKAHRGRQKSLIKADLDF
jgi:hypothetical protein